jgi:hypothetical protein
MDAGGGEVLQLHDRLSSKNLPEPIWRLADGFGVAADAAEARHRLSTDAYCALVLQPCGLRSLLVAGLHPAHHVCPSVRSRLGAELTRPEPGITHVLTLLVCVSWAWIMRDRPHAVGPRARALVIDRRLWGCLHRAPHPAPLGGVTPFA